MTAFPVTSRRVEKPWGRRNLPPAFAAPDDMGPIGEIIFEAPNQSDCELLLKFLFTSEKLSIQVHPDDDSARAGGHPRGKDEAWIVLGSEPDATIGLGLTRPISKEALRAAALDGSIESLVDWRSTAAGDFYYSPAGTIHAIGPGLTLLEIQQNLDLTYRLYDYGRPRELHLDDAVAAARPGPGPSPQRAEQIGPGRSRVACGPAFQVERLSGPGSGLLAPPAGELWLVSIDGGGEVAGHELRPGEVWLLDASHRLVLDGDLAVVIAYPGSYHPEAWRPD